MTTLSPTATAGLEAKIDALTQQVAFLTQEAESAKRRREFWTELQADAMPIAGDFLQVLERELDELRCDVCMADMADLLRRFVRITPIIDQGMRYLEMFADLASDMMPLGEHAMSVTTDRLVELDQKGYFGFAKSTWHVVDRIVTGFSEDDVEALGDNVVLILDTIKELTQPEIMAALHHMIEAVQRQQAQMDREPDNPPGLFKLAMRLRDPEVRRGMNRALNTLGAVAEVDPNEPISNNPTTNQ
jgi:uncharacterized protein YjgD (DUF1641 family)